MHRQRSGKIRYDPIIVDTGAIKGEGGRIGKALKLASDRFASQMLRMPSEKLSTTAALAVVSNEFSVILDLIDSEIVMMLSVERATRIKSYLSGSG